MGPEHHYRVSTRWTGNRGTGTSGYRDYSRQHVVEASGKHAIEGSSDRTFHGDSDRWNPEELLLAALSQCHMLSYLHVASSLGIVVVEYTDDAVGTMTQNGEGGGSFTSATLRPRVTISAGDPHVALEAHARASELCFIAASVNFAVGHEPVILTA